MAKALGKRVKEFRLAKLLTQPQLAVAIGISLATLVRIESGASVSDLTRARVDKFLNSQSAVEAA